MFKTKKDVDKHVSDILSKIKNENERNLRGFNFAKHYYNVKDYETAKRYLAGFLSLKEVSAPAHRLMGQIYEQSGHLERAVQSYKRCLEIDDHQKDVVLKICELYCQLPVDPERARYWADRAEKLFPHSEVVFRLRETLVSVDGDQDMQELEDLITNELVVRPRDVNLRIKLLKLFLDTERIKYAYEHAIDAERRRPYHNSVEWYYCLTDVFEAYLEEQNQEYTSSLCIHLLSALDRLISLNLEDTHETDKENRTSGMVCARSMASATALHSFDQHLYKAWQLKDVVADSWQSFLSHMTGQLYFHMATIVLKRIKLERGSQKEASRIGAALLLAAYSFKPPNLQTTWYHSACSDEQKMYKIWHEHACFRLSQSGHIIMAMCREDRSKWLGKIRDQVCTSQSKDKIFQRVFSARSQRQTMNTSYFMHEDLLNVMSLEFPDHKTLLDYDMVAHTLHPDSLHHLVWLAVQNYNVKDKVQPFYGFKVFDGLQYSVSRVENPSPESLCFLDVEAFLCATVHCSALALDERHSLSHTSPDMPPFLPASISDQLCTIEQAEWWKSAYSLFTNSAMQDLAMLRRRLQHGIEVIRTLGNHGMDARLVIHLAEVFADKAKELKAQTDNDAARADEINPLEMRAALYWKSAISLLEKLSSNQTIKMPKEILFPSYGRELSIDEIKKALEEGRFFLACQAMNEGNHEAAICAFENLRSPYASFYQALTYKKMAAEEFGGKPRESITSEMRSRHIILLTRARDALYVTLDRIRSDKKHPLNQALPEEIEDIETRLARIDPDTVQRRDFVDSDESFSQDSEEQDPDSPNQAYPSHTVTSVKPSLRNVTRQQSFDFQSPARIGIDHLDLSSSKQNIEHVRPSPERLDAQIRSLAIGHDTLVKSIVEQNKALLETNHSIVEELKQNKAVVEQLTAQLEELKKQIPLMIKSYRLPPMHRGGSRRSHPANQPHNLHDNEEEAENEDGYYDGYYYEDEDYDVVNAEREKQNFHYNPAYAYPDPPLHNDYPYGQTTGRGVTSHTGYPAFYPPGQGMSVQPIAPPHSGGIMQGQPSHPPMSAVAPQYYPHGSPSIFTGLPFSEGQKLPEFHFNMATPVNCNPVPDSSSKMAIFPQRLPPSANEIYSNSVISSLHEESIVSEIPNTSTTAAVTTASSELSNTPSEKVSFTSLKGSPSISSASPSLMTNQTTSTSVPVVQSEANAAASGTVPHAFQIPLPPQAVIVSSPSIALTAANGLKTSMTTPVDFSHPSNQSGISAINLDSVVVSSVRTRKDTEETGSSYHEEDSAGPDFKPAIPLPAEIEVKTGEEDEMVLFEDRAKLFRYVDKEWKERGVGTVKILHNENTNRVRILMRRDQILKTCANHYILPNMSLTPMKNADKVWIWAAQDYADEEMKMEQFCIRFKTAEIGQLFKTKFDLAKEIAAKSTLSVQESVNSVSILERGDDKTVVVETVGFGNRFRPKPGFWECSTCLVVNDADREMCIACSNPGPVPTKKVEEPPKATFKFGFLPSSAITGNDQSKPVFSFGFPAFNEPCSNSVTVGTTTTTTLATSANLIPTVFGLSSTTVQSVHPNVLGSTMQSIQPHGFVFGSACTGPQSKPSGHIFGASPVKTDNLEQPKETSELLPASQLLSELANKQRDTPDLKENKILFAGFSFNSTPVVERTEQEKADGDENCKMSKDSVVNAETSKPKPFAEFTFFVKSDKQASITSEEKSKPDNAKAGDPAAVFGSQLLPNVGNVETAFATLAQQHANPDAFRKDPNFEGFRGAGQSVFGRSGDSSREHCSGEEFEPNVDFKPLVSLPELIDVKTGEEDEEKLFGERAKLFRYVIETKEWKERGIGEIKILKHKTTGRLRVVMRREQVLKICANHYITKDMKLQPMSTSDKAWVWMAHDFSEGELRQEKLAVKFKTIEQAHGFKRIIESVQRAMSDQDKLSSVTTCLGDSASKSLAEMFKPQEGSWECGTCLVRNVADLNKCVACDTAKVGASSCPGLPLNQIFKPEEGSWECATCLVRNKKDSYQCVSCQTMKSGLLFEPKTDLAPGEFKFGFPVSPLAKNSGNDMKLSETISNPEFKLQSGKPVFQFGIVSKEQQEIPRSSTPSTSPSSVEFRFGTPQKFTFSFGGIRPKSPTKTPKSPVEESTVGEVDEDGGGAESEGDSIYFHPVIPLPDKVEVRTGEEDERVLYCQRAKLYRWADGEWKERGLGDFKILKHDVTGKVRLLMRREQILKICCNHYLTVEMTFLPKDDRSWTWHASDFSENEIKSEHLAIRFKTSEIAQAFKQAIEQAKVQFQENASSGQLENCDANSLLKSFSFKLEDHDPKASPTNVFRFGSKLSSLENVTPTSEIEIFYEKRASPTLVEKAKRLMLPENFYLYETLEPCKGCRGCWNEDSDTDSDISILYEHKPTKEQVEKALALQLPANFYSYEEKPPCPGCRGCSDIIPDIGSRPGSEHKNNKDCEQSCAEMEKSDAGKECIKTEENGTSFLGKTSVSMVSFADLSQKSTSFLLSSDSSEGFTFPGAGMQIFNKDKRQFGDDEDSNEHSETSGTGESHDPHFEPVIPLPELVSVTTGEEDEDKLFCGRCKLYRYDVPTKQWKERGIGELKILKHRGTQKCRVLMRREQVLKICCNHAITKDMQLKPMSTNETAWCWYANDFADEHQVQEKFAARFKTVEFAREFFNTFTTCQEEIAEINLQSE